MEDIIQAWISAGVCHPKNTQADESHCQRWKWWCGLIFTVNCKHKLFLKCQPFIPSSRCMRISYYYFHCWLICLVFSHQFPRAQGDVFKVLKPKYIRSQWYAPEKSRKSSLLRCWNLKLIAWKMTIESIIDIVGDSFSVDWLINGLVIF